MGESTVERPSVKLPNLTPPRRKSASASQRLVTSPAVIRERVYQPSGAPPRVRWRRRGLESGTHDGVPGVSGNVAPAAEHRLDRHQRPPSCSATTSSAGGR